ncbi:P-loop containing nucleoside triphosphate hydrolase protein [Bisporella sp. PMI_857]|nr:P-loop containing nucleoside triphosphate hydrolase protein [Bisporella sp. PMI_857]
MTDGNSAPQILKQNRQNAESPSSTNNCATESGSKRPERAPNISDYLRVFGYATRWDFCVYAIASLASLGTGITLPLMNIIFGQLVGQFTDYFKGSSTISSDDFRRILDQQALYIMALFVGRWGLNTINKFCFRMIGIRLSSAVRLHYLQSLFKQSIHVIDSMPPGAPATVITTTSNTLQLGISERLGTFLQFNGTIWAALVIAFVWSWDLTLVTSSLILYIIIVLSVVLPLIVKGQTATVQADAQGTAISSEALEGIRLVISCGAQGRIVSRYGGWVHEAMKRAQKIAQVDPYKKANGVEQFFGIFGAFGLAFWYGIQRYIAGAVSDAGVVIVVLMSVMMILTSLERISTPLMAVSKAMVAACKFFTVIDAPLPASGFLKPDITSEDLIFEDVTFEYPSRPGVRVLDALGFRIQSGRNTALVGPSGSGKSTILIEPKPPKQLSDERTNQLDDRESVMPVEPKLSGTITVGSHNLEDLDPKWWRAQIGLVQQEPFLFNDTIFGNVTNGLIGTKWADEPEERKRQLVLEACQEAYAHEFISRLPDGYDTRVGDGGVKLSGGQKQRLAIARSIIKKPQIIILDEANSSIDAKSKKIVQAALDRVTKNRTTITIAHRLSTIKKADHIIVLQHGRAVEQGTHQDLLAHSPGVYRTLVRGQSLRQSLAEEAEPALPTGGLDVGSEKLLNDHAQVDENPARSATRRPNTAGQHRNLIRSFGKLLYQQRAQWPAYLAIFISSMAVAAATPIQAWLFAKVLGVFLLGDDDIKAEGNFWGLMWFALAVGVGLACLFEGWISLHVQYSISAVLKMQYFTDMLYQKLSFFDEDNNSHGTLSFRVASDAKQLEELLGLNLAFLLLGSFTVAGCIIIALIFAWKAGLVATFITMPIMLASGYWKYRYEVQFDQMNSAVFMESSQFAIEAIGAIRTVSALMMEQSINTRYQQLLDGHIQAAFRKARWTSALFGFTGSAGHGCQATVFWYGGRLLASGEYTLEAFFVCFMAIIQGAEAASQALAVAPDAAQATGAANRILDSQEAVDISQAAINDNAVIPGTNDGVQIELRDVSFKYPTRDVLIFDGLSLRIEKGQYAAIVGPSGCGKTTIISLLERFYDLEPNQGVILCNGTNINDVGVHGYRQNLSLVTQEPNMFRGTVRDNILFGISDPSAISDERIHQVCRDASIHDFIISLPQGYDTDVGQKGVSISGGQKERVAIARALIRDPKILLLDEATSALDSEPEKTVQTAFERVRNKRTMVVVAHRLSTIQNADIIFVFDNGRVVEKGTYNELIKKHDVYWGMCQSQSLDC